jgi:hypothetical protein
MQSIGLEALITKRAELLAEKEAMTAQLNSEISEIESCIELLSGKKVWEITSETRYDDENPNYIKSSQEEM